MTFGPYPASGQPVHKKQEKGATMEPATGALFERVAVSDLRPEVRETHLSLLVFLGDRVYKARKPVRFGFVDLSEPAMREADCRREVEANRELAPDVYLGVASFVDEQAAVSHLVVMRRLPAERSLAALVAAGDEVTGHLREVARTLAGFHAKAARSDAISAAATQHSVARTWQQLFEESNRFVGSTLDHAADQEIHRLATRYVAGRERLFTERIERGRICDGHGDLQAEEVFCLPDGPRIIDRLEFDDRLRHLDVLSDLAFLAMDLERLGSPEASEALLAHYLELTGESAPRSLWHFYVAERAYVRGLVACLRGAQGAPDVALARRFHELAHDHLAAGRVRLVLVGGLPGTGKSTVAAAAADRLGATLLATDEIRRERFDAPGVHTAARYSDEARREVYVTMLERARVALERGESVVCDATFADESERAEARAIAAATSSDLDEVHCVCPGTEADARIRLRANLQPVLSEATEEVRAEMEHSFAPWPQAAAVDTSSSREHSLGLLLGVLGLSATGRAT